MRREAAALVALLIGLGFGTLVPAPAAAPLDPAAAEPPEPAPADVPLRASVALPAAVASGTIGPVGWTEWHVLPGTRDLTLHVLTPAGNASTMDDNATGSVRVVMPNGTVTLPCRGRVCDLEEPSPMPGLWILEPTAAGTDGSLSFTPGPMVAGGSSLYAASLDGGAQRTDFFLIDVDTPSFTLAIEHPTPTLGLSMLPSATLTEPGGQTGGACSGSCRLSIEDATPGWWKVQYGSYLPLNARVTPAPAS